MNLYFCSILKIRTLRLSDYAPDSSKEMQSKIIEDGFLNGQPKKGKKELSLLSLINFVGTKEDPW